MRRRSYTDKGHGPIAKEYRRGVMDDKRVKFYDKYNSQYKKQIAELEKKKKALHIKTKAAWEKFGALNEAEGKIDEAIAKIKSKMEINEKRKDYKFDKNGDGFFGKGYKSPKYAETYEFNDFDTNYMSPYAQGHTAAYRRTSEYKNRYNKKR